MIFIYTFHGVLNHGAAMQAYALQQFLESHSIDSRIVNYKPLYFLWQVYRPTKNPLNLGTKFSRILKFQKFHKKNSACTEVVIAKRGTPKEMRSGDVALFGSDQIWNRTLTGGTLDLAFFGEDLPNGVEKVAYAASAGGVPLSCHDVAAIGLLKRFKAIGVREQFLEGNLRDIGVGEKVETVIDPTFLIDGYRKLICRGKLSREIVTYEVSSDESRIRFCKAASYLKNDLNRKIHHIGDKFYPDADTQKINISPQEWINEIESASVVVTNSFHGVCLSINFEKDFYFVPHVEDEKNVRVVNLLRKCGVAIDGNSLAERVDGAQAKRAIALWVADSKRFLLESLRQE